MPSRATSPSTRSIAMPRAALRAAMPSSPTRPSRTATMSSSAARPVWRSARLPQTTGSSPARPTPPARALPRPIRRTSGRSRTASFPPRTATAASTPARPRRSRSRARTAPSGASQITAASGRSATATSASSLIIRPAAGVPIPAATARTRPSISIGRPPAARPLITARLQASAAPTRTQRPLRQ